MTQKEILEFNKLCSEFLKMEFEVHSNTWRYKDLITTELLFHSDWNWIKSLLEKISSLNEDDFSDETQQAFEDLLDLSLFSSKESVCESINNFIKTIKFGSIILNNLASKSAEITENIAIEFAKWIDDSSFTYYHEEGFWSSIATEEKKTSKELFQEFLKTKA